MYKFSQLALLPAILLLLSACEPVTNPASEEAAVEPQAKGPSVEEAATFVAEAEDRLAALGQNSERMALLILLLCRYGWINKRCPAVARP